MDYKGLETPYLVDRCVVRDPLAWAEFVTRFSALIDFAVKRMLSRFSGETYEEAAKDIKQDVLMSVWSKNKLNEVKNRQCINYWLVIVARNATLNYLKAKRKYVLSDDESYFERIPQPSVEGEFSDAVAEIKEIYSALGSKEKIIFKLYFKKGLSMKNVSGVLNVPAGTVAAAVARMRKKIRKMREE